MTQLPTWPFGHQRVSKEDDAKNEGTLGGQQTFTAILFTSLLPEWTRRFSWPSHPVFNLSPPFIIFSRWPLPSRSGSYSVTFFPFLPSFLPFLFFAMEPREPPPAASLRSDQHWQQQRQEFERRARRYFHQLTVGCGDGQCHSKFCASSPCQPPLFSFNSQGNPFPSGFHQGNGRGNCLLNHHAGLILSLSCPGLLFFVLIRSWQDSPVTCHRLHDQS